MLVKKGDIINLELTDYTFALIVASALIFELGLGFFLGFVFGQIRGYNERCREIRRRRKQWKMK